MLRIITLALIAASGLLCQARSAILTAHYGTSYHDTRAKTIDLIDADIATAFPGMDLFTAYISPAVRKNMSKDGYESLSPREALSSIANAGYDTVYVQCTTIIEGAETAEVREAVVELSPRFSLIKMGNPLCFSPADSQELAEILAAEPVAEDETVVYCGHGNNLPSTATYAMLDYMLMVSGIDRMHVSTIEGYPTVESTLIELAKTPEIRNVKLIPLLLVCGNHTINDIDGDYAEALKSAGYTPTTLMRGLAELPAVRQLYVRRVLRLVK